MMVGEAAERTGWEWTSRCLTTRFMRQKFSTQSAVVESRLALASCGMHEGVMRRREWLSEAKLLETLPQRVQPEWGLKASSPQTRQPHPIETFLIYYILA